MSSLLMPHLNLDTAVFGVYLVVVAAVGVLASRREKQSDDYFLAGRKLTWWVIGGSMIAANISTHHFIGMSGLAYQIGLGVASFEWIAAIALVQSGVFFLPYYLTQRTLAAKNLWHGQMGVVFAGFLKLFVLLLVVLPGIIAFRLYHPETGLLRAECVLEKPDLAFPTLVRQLLPPDLTGLVMAGMMGCVMSHIASMVSASSSILTFDIYQNYVNPGASSARLVRFGRVVSLLVLVLATVVGYYLRDLKTIFVYIQKYWSIAYPAACALFLAGFFYKRANARGSLVAIIAVPTWSALFTFVQSQPWFAELTFLEGVVSEPVRTALKTSVVGFLSPFLNRALVDFALALFLIWIFRTRGTTLPAGAVIDRSFPPDVPAAVRAIPWWQSFRLWAAALVICVAALYIRFF